ncbi:MAG: trypsin-like peptidase domain-containing protein [Deltaproteobacteria bacterium]|nr:trypsin-like peptidase domain-containing protein [Deltaproteobacteria bacterium]
MLANFFRDFLIRILILVVAVVVFQVYVADAQQEIEKSVVKIYTNQRRPDVFNPWSKMPANEISGTGVVITGNRILTNAHVVMYASQVYVQLYQSADRLPAKITGIAPGIDLALLEVDDGSFFSDHPPLPLSEIVPKTGQKVNAYGYPIGGTGISVTGGIISRIEFSPYYYNTAGLRIQVDAALNPGNSGGPAISENEIIGIVFSGIRQADNIGYIIPVEEINIFLKDMEDGRYDGKPMMFDQLQTLENDALREKLKLDKNQTGMMVTSPYGDGEEGYLKKWDIITKIGKEKIDNDGKIITKDGMRLHFAYLIQHMEKEGHISLDVLRDGKEIKIDMPLLREKNALVPELKDGYPSYFIYGPLVFSPATNDFLRYLQREWLGNLLRSSSPLITRLNDTVTEEQEQLIVISSRMFSHRITKGYGDPLAQVIKDLNGTQIRNIRHLVEVIQNSKEYIEINFEGNFVETMIFRKAEMEAATEDILTENGIRFQCSSDLMDMIKR